MYKLVRRLRSTPSSIQNPITSFIPYTTLRITMSTQKAVVHESPGVSVLKTDVPLPKLPAENWVLVKIKAVALNPTVCTHVHDAGFRLIASGLEKHRQSYRTWSNCWLRLCWCR